VTRGERFTPFLAFPPELRRVIYTTNSIESLNYQLRKITQEPRPLPQRSRDRAKERGLRTEQHKAPGHLVEGQATTNWKQALQQLSLAYPDRINPHL
jgi:transposase, mutator family